MQWKIICPADCCCKDPDVQEFVKEGKRFHREMIISASSGRIKYALTVEREGPSYPSWTQHIVEWSSFGSCISLFSTWPPFQGTKAVALRHLEAGLNVYRIIAPFSERTRMYEELLLEQPADLQQSALSVKEQLSAVITRFSSLLNDEWPRAILICPILITWIKS